MGRTACTEPQCLYKGALYLFVSQDETTYITLPVFPNALKQNLPKKFFNSHVLTSQKTLSILITKTKSVASLAHFLLLIHGIIVSGTWITHFRRNMPLSSSSDLKMAVVYASEIMIAPVNIYGVIIQNIRISGNVASISELPLQHLREQFKNFFQKPLNPLKFLDTEG